MNIPHPPRLEQRENSVQDQLEEHARRQIEFPTAEKRPKVGPKHVGNGRSLPPKCYMSSPDVKEENNLDKSAIEELKLLQGSNPTQEHIGTTSKTLEGMGIRRSHSFDRQKIELSLSSDYIDLEYDNSTLKKAIEEMAKRLESGLMRERAKQKQADFYMKKAEELEERCEELQRLVETLDGRIEELEWTVKQKQEELRRSMEESGKINENYRNEICEVKQSFQKARDVGQQQINQLLTQLTLKQQEIVSLKTSNLPYTSTTLAQPKSIIAPGNTRPSIVTSRAAANPPETIEHSNYLTRFFRFANTLDRKLTRSCCKPPSSIHNNPTRSMMIETLNSVIPNEIDETHLRTLQTHNNRLLRLLDHNQTINRQLQSYHQQLLP